MNDEIVAAVEAVLFAAGEPVHPKEIADAFDGVDEAAVRAAIEELERRSAAGSGGLVVEQVAGAYRLATKPAVGALVRQFFRQRNRTRLSPAALETLAIVAYRQPVTRARVSAVRGVNVDAVIRSLLARGLITEAGTDPDTGAQTFTTTELFLERLGLSSLSELPDIAPLLPDVDVIDDLSESLDLEPRFAKLSGGQPEKPVSFDVDTDG